MPAVFHVPSRSFKMQADLFFSRLSLSFALSLGCFGLQKCTRQFSKNCTRHLLEPASAETQHEATWSLLNTNTVKITILVKSTTRS